MRPWKQQEAMFMKRRMNGEGRHSGSTHDLSQALVQARDAIRPSDVREKALAPHHQRLQVHLHRSTTRARSTGTNTIPVHCVHSAEIERVQRWWGEAFISIT